MNFLSYLNATKGTNQQLPIKLQFAEIFKDFHIYKSNNIGTAEKLSLNIHDNGKSECTSKDSGNSKMVDSLKKDDYHSYSISMDHLKMELFTPGNNDFSASKDALICNKNGLLGNNETNFNDVSSTSLISVDHQNVNYTFPSPSKVEKISKGTQFMHLGVNKKKNTSFKENSNKQKKCGKDNKKYCKLQIQSFDKKRSLNFDLHPLFEEFLVRTMDKLSNNLHKEVLQDNLKKGHNVNKSKKKQGIYDNIGEILKFKKLIYKLNKELRTDKSASEAEESDEMRQHHNASPPKLSSIKKVASFSGTSKVSTKSVTFKSDSNETDTNETEFSDQNKVVSAKTIISQSSLSSNSYRKLLREAHNISVDGYINTKKTTTTAYQSSEKGDAPILENDLEPRIDKGNVPILTKEMAEFSNELQIERPNDSNISLKDTSVKANVGHQNEKIISPKENSVKSVQQNLKERWISQMESVIKVVSGCQSRGYNSQKESIVKDDAKPPFKSQISQKENSGTADLEHKNERYISQKESIAKVVPEHQKESSGKGDLKHQNERYILQKESIAKADEKPPYFKGQISQKGNSVKVVPQHQKDSYIILKESSGKADLERQNERYIFQKESIPKADEKPLHCKGQISQKRNSVKAYLERQNERYIFQKESIPKADAKPPDKGQILQKENSGKGYLEHQNERYISQKESIIKADAKPPDKGQISQKEYSGKDYLEHQNGRYISQADTIIKDVLQSQSGRHISEGQTWKKTILEGQSNGFVKKKEKSVKHSKKGDHDEWNLGNGDLELKREILVDSKGSTSREVKREKRKRVGVCKEKRKKKGLKKKLENNEVIYCRIKTSATRKPKSGNGSLEEERIKSLVNTFTPAVFDDFQSRTECVTCYAVGSNNKGKNVANQIINKNAFNTDNYGGIKNNLDKNFSKKNITKTQLMRYLAESCWYPVIKSCNAPVEKPHSSASSSETFGKSNFSKCNKLFFNKNLDDHDYDFCFWDCRNLNNQKMKLSDDENKDVNGNRLSVNSDICKLDKNTLKQCADNVTNKTVHLENFQQVGIIRNETGDSDNEEIFNTVSSSITTFGVHNDNATVTNFPINISRIKRDNSKKLPVIYENDTYSTASNLTSNADWQDKCNFSKYLDICEYMKIDSDNFLKPKYAMDGMIMEIEEQQPESIHTSISNDECSINANLEPQEKSMNCTTMIQRNLNWENIIEISSSRNNHGNSSLIALPKLESNFSITKINLSDGNYKNVNNGNMVMIKSKCNLIKQDRCKKDIFLKDVNAYKEEIRAREATDHCTVTEIDEQKSAILSEFNILNIKSLQSKPRIINIAKSTETFQQLHTKHNSANNNGNDDLISEDYIEGIGNCQLKTNFQKKDINKSNEQKIIGHIDYTTSCLFGDSVGQNSSEFNVPQNQMNTSPLVNKNNIQSTTNSLMFTSTNELYKKRSKTMTTSSVIKYSQVSKKSNTDLKRTIIKKSLSTFKILAKTSSFSKSTANDSSGVKNMFFFQK